MDIQALKKEVLTQDFIITFISIFIILYLVTSFVIILGSLPMLIIISAFLSYYLIKKGTKIMELAKFVNKK